MVEKIAAVVIVVGLTALATLFTPSEELPRNRQVIQNGTIIYPSIQDASILSNFDADSIAKSIKTGEPYLGNTFEEYIP